MKKLLFFFVMFFMGLTLAFAQAPSTPLTYQSVVRNAQNQLVINQANITVTVSVWNAAGTSELYRESHSGLSTNDNGLLTLMLGSGTVNLGTWASIDWSNASIKTVISYTTTEGTVSITSDPAPVTAVPYAIQAGNVTPQVNADWNATDGAAQILNKPTIPDAQVNADWNATDGVAQILNKPTIPDAQVNADWNATDGVAQILNKPTIPDAQVNADWNATSGVAQILNRPDVNDATLTIKQGDATLGTFSANAGTDATINVPTPAAQVNADWNATSGAAQILNKPTIPTVPTNVSAFTNDAGYITSSDVPAQVNADWNATSGAAQILNKPTIPAAQVNSDWNATSGVSQILNKPDLSGYATQTQLNDFQTSTNNTLTGINTNITNLQTQVTTNHNNIEAVQNSIGNGTLTIQTNGTTTGTFTANQATNQTINIDVPAAQVQSNWTETDNTVASYIQNKPNLANVATSGSYNDLSDKPAINDATLTIKQGDATLGTFTANAGTDATITVPTPTAQVQADWSETTTTSAAYIQNKPANLVQDASYVHTDNNYTTADKDKLASIAAGAEVNVQSDWSQSDATADDFIKNKPAINDGKLIVTYGTESPVIFTANQAGNTEVTIPAPAAQVQADWTETTTTSASYIQHKPTLATVATSGSYNDLSNTPAINNATLTIKQGETTLGTFTANASDATTITVPTPAAQVQADWTETSTTSASYIQNKPENLVQDASYVHTDNNYTTADKTKLAGIEAGAEVNVQANWAQTNTTADDYIMNKPTLATVATTGNYSDLNGTPTLATVATTGSYNNLTDQPAINDGTLTIQKNGTEVGAFTANQSTASTVNITVPTTVAELTDAADYATRPGANTFSGANDFTTGSITVPNAITTIDAAVANCTQDAVSVCDLITVYNALLERIAVLEATVSSITENLTVPTVTTSAVTNLTASKATIGGVLVSAGAEGAPSVTERGVCYSTTNNTPTITTDTKVADASTTTGTFSHTLTGLPANTTYYVRAYATASDNNTYYGDVVTFTTLTPTLGVVPDQASPRVVCGEGDVIYTAEMEGDDIANYTLAWYVDETVQDGQTNTTFTVHSTATVNYTVKCVATRLGENTEASTTMNITVNPNPDATLTRLEGNMGDDWGKVQISDATELSSASWKLNDEEVGTWTSGKTAVLPIGTYNVILTSGEGCEITKTVTIRTTPICVANYISEKETYYELAGKKYVKTIKDHENNEYNVLQIGTRCWTRENMRAVTSPTTGSYLIANYSNTASKSACWAGDSSIYAPQNYGVHYNWQAMTDVYNADYPEIADRPNNVDQGGTGDIQVPHITHPWRGICPEGWQLSQKSDYDALKSTFTTFGQLSTGTSWLSSSGSTAGNQSYTSRNISGFSALPAGMDGGALSQAACFWTGTEYAEYNQNWRSCLYAYLYNASSWYSFDAYGVWPWHQNRASVRCIRSNSAALILSRTPGSSQVGAGTSVAYTASITNDDPSGYTYTWMVDGTAQSETSNTFNYTFNESGNHTVSCEATGNGNTFTQSLSTLVAVTPEVSTSAATGVGFNVATVGGNVTEVGYPAITKRGIVYSTTAAPTTTTGTKVEDASATAGEYSTMLTGLADHTTYYVRAYATNSNGTVYGDEITFTTLQCGVDDLTDADGNTYNTLVYGTQCWIKSNLRTTKFADGSDITRGDVNVTSTTAPYYFEPNATNIAEDFNEEGYNAVNFGRYYNYPAVTSTTGLCPLGWHVPSKAEWDALISYVGTNYPCGTADAYAKALASQYGWVNEAFPAYYGTIFPTTNLCAPAYQPSNNNASGFSMYGGTGAMQAGSGYVMIGYEVGFWCSEFNMLNFYGAGVNSMYTNAISASDGIPVRCLRD